MSKIIYKEIQVHWCMARCWVVRGVPFEGMHQVLDTLPTQSLAIDIAKLHAFGSDQLPRKALQVRVFKKSHGLKQIISPPEDLSEKVSSHEELVMRLAREYCERRSFPFDIPSVGTTIGAMELEKPVSWWGSAHDVYEWALRLRDEIIEIRNYMASQGRGLHDEPVDRQTDYVGGAL